MIKGCLNVTLLFIHKCNASPSLSLSEQRGFMSYVLHKHSAIFYLLHSIVSCAIALFLLSVSVNSGGCVQSSTQHNLNNSSHVSSVLALIRAWRINESAAAS